MQNLNCLAEVLDVYLDCRFLQLIKARAQFWGARYAITVCQRLLNVSLILDSNGRLKLDAQF